MQSFLSIISGPRHYMHPFSFKENERVQSLSLEQRINTIAFVIFYLCGALSYSVGGIPLLLLGSVASFYAGSAFFKSRKIQAMPSPVKQQASLEKQVFASGPVEKVVLPRELAFYDPLNGLVCSVVHKALAAHKKSVYTRQPMRLPGASGDEVCFHYKGEDGIIHHQKFYVSNLYPQEQSNESQIFENQLLQQNYKKIEIHKQY